MFNTGNKDIRMRKNYRQYRKIDFLVYIHTSIKLYYPLKS